MIPVKEAKDLVQDHSRLAPPRKCALLQATGHILACDVFSDQDFPSFEQAAMDGYAFHYDDLRQTSILKIAGESPAGCTGKQTVGRHQAVRIFTGAPLPKGADTVVMQERTEVHGDQLTVKDKLLKQAGNVRPTGSEIVKGALAMSKGSVLTPAAIGFLASLGKKEIQVFPKPCITLIITGNELVAPGEDLLYGKVYESNSFALSAALEALQLPVHAVHHAADDLFILEKILSKSVDESDFVLLTGGVSTGDYDYVASASAHCGVQQIFHRVKQKPGKPLFFGRKEQTCVFGLPGNPSSVLTCFYEYVVPAIRRQMGFTECFPGKKHARLLEGFRKKPGMTHFLKGLCQEGTVSVLDAQESYRMRSFAVANCLIVLEEEKTEFEPDELVEVHLLP